MAQSNFKVGDIVTLKSGSPEMTINQIISQTGGIMGLPTNELEINEIKVSWFDKGKLEHAKFTEPQLEKVQNITDEYFKSE